MLLLDYNYMVSYSNGDGEYCVAINKTSPYITAVNVNRASGETGVSQAWYEYNSNTKKIRYCLGSGVTSTSTYYFYCFS